MRMDNRTTLADALHQAGRLEEAGGRFPGSRGDAKGSASREYPLLYSSQGYQYCDLLLSQGEHEAVLHRAAQTLEWAEQYNCCSTSPSTTSPWGGPTFAWRRRRAARRLFPGRPPSRPGRGRPAPGREQIIARGLLARAALHRVTGAFERAQRDLDEARLIAERGGMRLYLADVHLELARLALAQGDKDEARQHLATAKAMVEEMGYHRRDGEVAELEAASVTDIDAEAQSRQDAEIFCYFFTPLRLCHLASWR